MSFRFGDFPYSHLGGVDFKLGRGNPGFIVKTHLASGVTFVTATRAEAGSTRALYELKDRVRVLTTAHSQ